MRRRSDRAASSWKAGTAPGSRGSSSSRRSSARSPKRGASPCGSSSRASARFLARATAARDGRTRANEADVANGIQLVEKHYATHTRLDEAFARGPVRALFREIAARPAYALALLRA